MYFYIFGYRELVYSTPALVVSYAGGLLAQEGSLSPADITGFRSALDTMVSGIGQCYSNTNNLLELDDRRFEYCFNLMDLMNKKPKIGLSGGYQPPARPKKTINPSAKLQRVLDDPAYRISGDIEFSDVSFKYKGMRLFYFECVCLPRGAGRMADHISSGHLEGDICVIRTPPPSPPSLPRHHHRHHHHHHHRRHHHHPLGGAVTLSLSCRL